MIVKMDLASASRRYSAIVYIVALSVVCDPFLTGKTRLVKRKLQFDDHPHLLKTDDPTDDRTNRRHLLALPEISPDVNSKERVIALAKLNVLAYDLRARTSWLPPSGLGYAEDVMQGVFDDPSATSGMNREQAGRRKK